MKKGDRSAQRANENEEWERQWGFPRPETEVERQAFKFGIRLGWSVINALLIIAVISVYIGLSYLGGWILKTLLGRENK